MSANFSTTARPSHAVTAWVDDVNVYVELACKNAPPYVMKFPLTDAGLSKALNLMREVHRKKGGSRQKDAPHPLVQRKGDTFSQEQRDTAKAVLRRLKII